jgi:hypothetical protein
LLAPQLPAAFSWDCCLPPLFVYYYFLMAGRASVMMLLSLSLLAHAPTIILCSAVFLQTNTRKATNGDCHAMLKVIQCGLVIPK